MLVVQIDCFFRVVSHQLYDDLSYHMNIRSTAFNIRETTQKDSLNVVQTLFKTIHS